MASVCKHCFADKELVAFIDGQARIADCDFCDQKSLHCIEAEELFDFFAELLTNFKPEPGGMMLKSKIQGNWSLFGKMDSAYGLLNYFLSNHPSAFITADDLVDFSDDVHENISHWDQLKQELIGKHRYITDVNHLTYDLGWDGFFSSQIEIPKGKELFRARLHHNSGEPAYSGAVMFCPPKAISTAGRANPSGIPYLYLSDNKETVLYEVRAAYLDEVSIGTFVVKPSITDPVLIADFTESGTIFHPGKVSEKIKASLLKQKISADLSKPMRRYDSELDYVPTQFICEFISIYTGVHGIKFRSSLHITGNNFVIFDQELFECTKVEQVKIRKVTIAI